MHQGLLVLSIILVLVLIAIGFWELNDIEKNKHFLCKNCGTKLKVSKYKLLITPHYFSRRYLKCPSCKQRSWMYPEND
jgi:uncharacterized membrane protein